jgi:hypothetical protein
MTALTTINRRGGWEADGCAGGQAGNLASGQKGKCDPPSCFPREAQGSPIRTALKARVEPRARLSFLAGGCLCWASWVGQGRRERARVRSGRHGVGGGGLRVVLKFIERTVEGVGLKSE